MFKLVFTFVLSSIISCINLLKHFVLDSSSGINLFHFFVFLIFASIVLRLITFIKDIQEVESDKVSNNSKGKRLKK